MPKIDKLAIRELAKQHNIAPYSAKMVLKEKWTLDYAQTLEKPVFNLGVKWLLSAKKKKATLAFRTFDRGTVLGKVVKVRKFNNLLLVRGKLRYIEKIDTAYVYNTRLAKLIPEYIRMNPAFEEGVEKPAYKPSDRKPIDLSCLDVHKSVRMTLYTGELLEGVVAWVSEFDFELKLDRYISVLVFKHAVAEASIKEFHRFKQPIRERPARKLGHRPFDREKRPDGAPRSFGPRPPKPHGGSGGQGGFGPVGFGPKSGSFGS